MFDILAAIERLPLVGLLKTSFYVYPLVNALHVLSVGAVVTMVILMDLRILGLAGSSLRREPFLHLMRKAIAIVLPVAVLSGLTLFSVRAQEYATNSAFQAKMALLALAGLNLWLFGRLASSVGEDSPVPAAAKALAGVSMAVWVAILVAGRFIGFI